MNSVEAANWFRKAADQGFPAAEYELAQCYFDGKGVTKDTPDAIAWMQKSAEHGFAKAQDAIARCYVTGDGVPKDYVQAYKWYALAEAQDDAHADDIKVSIAKVSRLMTPDQIAEAQRLAHDFKAASQTSPPTSQAQPADPPPAQPVPQSPGSATGSTPSKTGVVNVNAGDGTCEVFADGSFVGNSPARLRLSEGSHVVEVKKDGFKPYRREITVTEGSELNLNLALVKL
jgi:hypothetical protein